MLTTTAGSAWGAGVAPTRHLVPAAGWAEHDAESLWWADFCALTAEILASTPHRPDAVCVSGIGPCVLPTDDAGVPLRQAILYGIDTRAVEIGKRIQDELGGADAVLAKCGSVISAQAAGPKIAWIRAHEPDVWARYPPVLHGAQLHRAPAHRPVRSRSSVRKPMRSAVRPARPERHAAIADTLAPGLELPRLAWPAQIAGEITDAAASLTGLVTGIRSR